MPPTPPNAPFNWRRLSKTLSFWVLLILVPVVIVLAILKPRSKPRRP